MGAAVNRRGVTLVEVLVALTLIAIQVPAAVATVASAAALTRRAEAVLASIDAPGLVDRCARS
jgi:prepilin-type N-terminal cleavage/methylation domain-containing protein